MTAAHAPRSALAITLTVWRALFLREVVSRLSQTRFAWLWLIVEPLAHVVMLMVMFKTGFRARAIAGGDVAVFIMLGVLGFFMARNIMTRSMDAVSHNEALYAFRQIKPVDAVFTRAAVEALLACVLLTVMLLATGLFQLPVVPEDPLLALAAIGGLALTGFGMGLALSVVGNLVEELGRVLRLFMTPLYFLSGVIFPSVVLPIWVRDVLLYNPLLHGIELLRVAFMPGYQVPPGLDLVYLYQFGVVVMFLGLALHVRFRGNLLTE